MGSRHQHLVADPPRAIGQQTEAQPGKDIAAVALRDRVVDALKFNRWKRAAGRHQRPAFLFVECGALVEQRTFRQRIDKCRSHCQPVRRLLPLWLGAQCAHPSACCLCLRTGPFCRLFGSGYQSLALENLWDGHRRSQYLSPERHCAILARIVHVCGHSRGRHEHYAFSRCRIDQKGT